MRSDPRRLLALALALVLVVGVVLAIGSQVVGRLARQGWEIGLHAPYRATDSPDGMARAWRRLGASSCSGVGTRKRMPKESVMT